MVTDLRRDPIFKKGGVPSKAKEPVKKELILKYKQVISQTIASRTWIMLFIGVGVYVAFNLLDQAVYPVQAPLFFKIRLIASLLTSIICLPNFFQATKKYSIWSVDLGVIVLIGGICLMIYLTDGASSHYHAGINLTLLGMATINGFYLWHNLATCLVVIGLYSAAVLANGAGWNGGLFFVACCFMSGTMFFILLMTKFYSSVHFKSFVQNEKLKEDERKLEILYGMAEEKSKIDDLTKLYNRGYFFEILSAKINACKNAGSFFYLIIFDIDHFKGINDTCGHVFGDQVIAAVAKTVQNVMRLNSYIGRYGGDEFMLIIDKATREELLFRLQRIREAIRNLELVCDGKPVKVTASFGAARWESETMDEKKLIELADEALLEIKRTQRGEIKLAN